MTFDDFQDDALTTVSWRDDPAKLGGCPPVAYCALGLTGEAGETADCIKKAFRDDAGFITPERHRKVILELGDVLWYAATLAHELGVDLSTVARMNVEKRQRRAITNTIHGEGSDR